MQQNPLLPRSCPELQDSGSPVEGEAGRYILWKRPIEDSDVHLGMGTSVLNFPTSQESLIIWQSVQRNYRNLETISCRELGVAQTQSRTLKFPCMLDSRFRAAGTAHTNHARAGTQGKLYSTKLNVPSSPESPPVLFPLHLLPSETSRARRLFPWLDFPLALKGKGKLMKIVINESKYCSLTLAVTHLKAKITS